MITLECNYSKKIGLPQYSSHQFSITLKTEIADVNQVGQESARLYRLLQDGVDSSIQQIGYLPGKGIILDFVRLLIWRLFQGFGTGCAMILCCQKFQFLTMATVFQKRRNLRRGISNSHYTALLRFRKRDPGLNSRGFILFWLRPIVRKRMLRFVKWAKMWGGGGGGN